MDYVIVCAPSGTGERSAVDKISESLVNLLKRRGLGQKAEDLVGLWDVEDQLCRCQEIREEFSSLSKRRVTKTRFQMREITDRLPRNIVAQRWKEQLRKGLNKLAEDNKPLNIVLCHTVLHGHVRGEFYSPVDVATFLDAFSGTGGQAAPRPTHVLLLLDDVYDMFRRLSANDHLYDKRAGDNEIRQSWLRAGHTDEEPIGFSDLERDYIEFRWKLNRLIQLLNWRNSETLAAESLAEQLGAKFLAMSCKQNTAVAAKWLREKTSKAVYLSHPITQSRTHYIDTGGWDNFVPTFNQIQRRMLQENVLCIMPTGIDEFRFPTTKTVSGMARPIVGSLHERWPLPETFLIPDPDKEPGNAQVENQEPFFPYLYTLPSGCSDINHSNFFGDAAQRLAQAQETGADEGKNASGLLEMFFEQARAHVAARDHLLVAHSDALLVYRGLYNKGGFAGGVRDEIRHWFRLEAEPRIVFIHFRADIVTEFSKVEIQKNMRTWSESEAGRLAADSFGNSMSVEEATKALRGERQSNIGEAEGTDLQITEHAAIFLNEARLHFVWQQLTQDNSHMDSNHAGLWIVENDQEVWQQLPEIARFLNSSSPQPPTDWKNVAEDILQSLGHWGATADSSAVA